MIELVTEIDQADLLTTRALNQAARKLLLVQSSDGIF